MKKIILIETLVLMAISLGGVIHKLGNHAEPSGVSSLALHGHYAYVTKTYQTGVKILDISDPAAPTQVSSFFAGYSGHVYVSGNRAYISGAITTSQGLEILDISDPLDPVSLGNLAGHGGKLALQGDYVYQAGCTEGLLIVDVSDPTNPVQVCQHQGDFLVNDVAVAGNYAYLAAGNVGGLQILNVADPQNPYWVGSCDTPGWANGIAIVGNTVYMADGYFGVQIIDVANPQNPVLLGNFHTYWSALRIVVLDNVAYVSEGYAGVQLIDVTDPVNPALISSYDTPGNVGIIEVRDGIAYLTDAERGVQILDVSSPANPALISQIHPESLMYDFAISGNLACVSANSYDLEFYDLTDMQNPVWLGHVNLGPLFEAEKVVISGDLAYVAGWREYDFDVFKSCLWLVDIADPANPVLLGDFESPWGIWANKSIFVVGNTAYFDHSSGLHIIDASDPQNPILSAYYGLGFQNHDVWVSNNVAYISYWASSDYAQGSGLWLIDVSNPQAPFLLGECTTPGLAAGVTVLGNVAYIADNFAGVQIVDVSYPSNPRIVGNLPTRYNGNVDLVRIFDGCLYAADSNWNEIQIYDLANPLRPQLIKRYDWSLSACELQVIGNTLYACNPVYGLSFHNLTQVEANDPLQTPIPLPQLAVYPNPFNPQTCFEFELPESSPVSLKIYNLKGQLVRELCTGCFAKGKHKLVWDGRDDHGRVLASGIYLSSLRYGETSVTRKAILAK